MSLSPAPGVQRAPEAEHLSSRGFTRRRVPSLPLGDGAIGDHPYNRWMQFAGVDSTQVGVSGERVLYTAAGVILGGYTLYAFIGVFAFAWMATSSIPAAIVSALVIGTIIISINLSIDRGLIGYIPAQLDHPEDPERDRQPLLENNKVKWARRLRVLLAILFALAVGEPANLFLFGKDVDAALATRNASVAQQQQRINERNAAGEIAAQQAIIDSSQRRIQEINAQADALVAKAQAEREGSGATGEAGCGPQCREYLRAADQARAAAPALIVAETAKITAANDRLDALRAEMGQRVQEAREYASANDGFLAREQVLLRALQQDPVLLLRYLIVVLVFFALEMGAVLTKYLARGNNYERESARRARLSEYASLVRSRNERTTIAHRDDLNRRMSIEADEDFYARRSAAFRPDLADAAPRPASPLAHVEPAPPPATLAASPVTQPLPAEHS